MGRAFAIFHSAYPANRAKSGAEHLTATTATGGQHTAAILGGHAGTEAMHLAALTLLGLVSTEHREHSLLFSVCMALRACIRNAQDTTKQPP